MFETHRRIYERFPMESSASLTTEKDKYIAAILTDISAGGAGLVSSFPFDAREKVELRIKSCFLFKDDLKRKARVVWCNKLGSELWQAGLEFGMDNLIDLS
jgi:hypothetical protein